MNDSGLTLYRQEKLQNRFKYIKKKKKNPKIALLHIIQICPVGRIRVLAGPILDPEPYVWHPCSRWL